MGLRYVFRDLTEILEEVGTVQSATPSKRTRHKLVALTSRSTSTSMLQKCSDNLAWAVEEFGVSSTVDCSHLSLRLTDTAQVYPGLADAIRFLKLSLEVRSILVSELLRSLPRARTAGHGSERPDRPGMCLEGTRTNFLNMIMDWVTTTDPTIPRIFWIEGMAGVGKSAITRTIAQRAGDMGHLGGEFFFSAEGDKELRDPALVFPTIAYQLARFDPEFGQRLIMALQADPDVAFAAPQQQLQRLFVKPLSGLQRDATRNILIVLDAIDECEDRDDHEILQLLVAAQPTLPCFLKILISSRPEPRIRSILSNQHTVTLHNIEASVVKDDIRLYLQTQLTRLPEKLNVDLPQDWVTDREIETLVDGAGTLFLYAVASVGFLSESLDPRRALDVLLKMVLRESTSPTGDLPFIDLDHRYLAILRSMVQPTSVARIIQAHQAEVGPLVLLKDSLPVDALYRLLRLTPPGSSNVFTLLHSVIIPPGPPDHFPRIYHSSFRDFLLDPTRCVDARFHIDTKKHETNLALRCLHLVNDSYKRLLDDFEMHRDRKIHSGPSPELRYACRFLASHLAAAAEGDLAIMTALERFGAKTLLPWIEWMSGPGDVDMCLKCLEDLNSWAVRDIFRRLLP